MDLNISFDDKPQLELGSYEPVHAHVEPAEVTEAMVDEQLRREMDRFAVVSDVDGAVAEGDNILVDMQVTLNGAPAPDLSGEGMSVMLLRGMMPDGFVEGVAGMEVGDRRSFDFAAADVRDASSVPDEFHVDVAL